ncbi:MAG: hypothetical protein QM706_05230 [Nitrospira sp.]
MNSSVPIELVAGAIFFIGGMLWTGSLFRTWLSSPPTGSAASDHLFVSTFFLIFTIILGMLVGANHFSTPPALPYGTLHLVAYTHMTFIGFIMNALMGISSYCLPIALADSRVPNAKKRASYLEQLNAVMNRWSILQIGALSSGNHGAWPLSRTHLECAADLDLHPCCHLDLSRPSDDWRGPLFSQTDFHHHQRNRTRFERHKPPR